MKCGPRSFLFEVTHPAGVVYSTKSVKQNATGMWVFLISYITDRQQVAGVDVIDSGVAAPGTADFIGTIELDGAQVHNEVRVQRTCP